MDTKERRKKYKAIRNLSSNAKKIVFRIHKITEEAWNAIEFIINSGKVPELIMRKAFKAKTKKYDVTGWTPFLYINLKKAPFFLYGQSVAISKVALFDLTKLVEKEIKGAKESETEDLEQALFYFEELHSKLPSKMKGCATGKMKFIKYGKDKKTAHLLVKKADFEKEGPGSKEDFLDNINALELENSNKTKMVLSFVQGETTSDVSESTDAAATLRKQATSLAASFKNFVSVEWAAVKQNSKSAKVIMAANNKGRSIATKMSTWLSTNTDNADAAIEVTAVRSYAEKLNTLLDQIKPSVDKINQSTEGSGVTLEGLSVDISDKINRLIQNYAVEIDQVEQLKEALDALK